MCKLYLDRGQALVLAAWFSHKTRTTHTCTHTHAHTDGARASQLVILDAAGTVSSALCWTGWLNLALGAVLSQSQAWSIISVCSAPLH